MSSKDYRTRRMVCRAFIDLLNQMPYHRISVLRLTRHAHVSRTAFYNNFKSLDDVVFAIYDYSIQHIYQDKFSCPDYVASMEYIQDSIRYFDLFSSFLLAVERQDIAKYYNMAVKKRVLPEFKTNDPIVTAHADYYQAFYLSPVFHVCTLWLHKGKKESPEELLEICKHLHERACTCASSRSETEKKEYDPAQR